MHNPYNLKLYQSGLSLNSGLRVYALFQPLTDINNIIVVKFLNGSFICVQKFEFYTICAKPNLYIKYLHLKIIIITKIVVSFALSYPKFSQDSFLFQTNTSSTDILNFCCTVGSAWIQSW